MANAQWWREAPVTAWAVCNLEPADVHEVVWTLWRARTATTSFSDPNKVSGSR